MLIGSLGWITFIHEKFKINIQEFFDNKKARSNEEYFIGFEKFINKRKGMIRESVGVAILTGVTYFAFFFRDIFMTYKYGFTEQLDIFFIAMLIPMFFVNTISICSNQECDQKVDVVNFLSTGLAELFPKGSTLGSPRWIGKEGEYTRTPDLTATNLTDITEFITVLFTTLVFTLLC